VVLVGNGGGYGYGVMGATHHALEDYGALLCLPKLRAYLPAFDDDLRVQVDRLFAATHPGYLRLGRSELPPGVATPAYAPWRRLLAGEGWVVLAAGTLVGGLWQALRGLEPALRPSLWLVSELPPDPISEAFLADLARSRRLLVVEEHVAQGGLAQMIAGRLLADGHAPDRFISRTAQGYMSGRYGSQEFHRREAGLDPEAIARLLTAEAN
jgi:transketolase